MTTANHLNTYRKLTSAFTKIKLLSLNVNGLRIQNKRRALFHDFRSHKADLIFLQETHSTLGDVKIWNSEWGSKGIFSHGRSNSKGVAILFRRGFNPSIHNCIADPEGRFLILQIELEGESLTLVNVYAPTQSEGTEQITFIERLNATLDGLEISDILMGGDFNISLHHTSGVHVNSSPQAGISSETQPRLATRATYLASINDLLNQYSISNAWTYKFPASKKPTFHRGNQSSTLDYWFLPDHLLNSISDIAILPHPLSDHSILSIAVGVSSVERGPGYWRFNNQLLTHPDFIQQMSDHILESLEEEFDNPVSLWEWVKYKIRQFCIKYSINSNREKKAHLKALESRLRILSHDHDLTGSPDIIAEATSIQRELAEIKLHDANNIIFRSRTRWAMAGEKPSAYFLGLERRQRKANIIKEIKDPQGNILTDSKSILDAQKNYFANIYSEDDSSLNSIDTLPLTEEDVPKISKDRQKMLELPFSTREFRSALNELGRNKSPGSDGITVEFYLKFWNILGTPFFESILHSIQNGTLSNEQKTGIITLIPKKGGDLLELGNWRPITLLNTDFKIFSKALSKRIQPCMKEIINENQTGFIRGRTIGTNIINTQTILDHSATKGTQGFLLAVDYAKAFDSIRWKLLYKALDLFGFGESIIHTIKILFHDIKTTISNNGFSSAFFFPSRGIRQGCCSSPSLFVIAVELMAIMLRKNVQIKGIQIANKSILLSQYADDTTLFLADYVSLRSALLTLEEFATWSGLKINSYKSHLLLLGNHLDPPLSFHNIKVVSKVKILGIYFKTLMTPDENYNLNFEPNLKKIQSICNAWSNRSLSLKGKITLISSLMISLLQFPCTSIPTPPKVFQVFKKMTNDFLWNGKRNKIAYNVLIQSIEHGGLKLPDLWSRVQVIHLNWIKYMWKYEHCLLSETLRAFFNFPDIRSLLSCTTNLASRLGQNYQMLTNILRSWFELQATNPTTESEVQEQPLWLNERITMGKKTICWRPWLNAGIIRVNNLLHQNYSRFMSHEELSVTYNINVSFLQMLQIRSCLPFTWRRLLVGMANPDITIRPQIQSADGSRIDISNITSKKIYSHIILRKQQAISAQKKWHLEFPPPHWGLSRRLLGIKI